MLILLQVVHGCHQTTRITAMAFAILCEAVRLVSARNVDATAETALLRYTEAIPPNRKRKAAAEALRAARPRAPSRASQAGTRPKHLSPKRLRSGNQLKQALN